MFKKTVSIMVLSAAFAAQAQAAPAPAPKPSPSDYGFFFKPYVGADYQYAYVNYKDELGINGSDIAANSLSGGDVHVGARIHKYLGVEAAYMQTEKGSKNDILGTGVNSKVDVKGFTLDAMGYLPVDDAGKFELIGTVGVSRLKGEVDFTGAATGTENASETKGRFGGGAQYWVTDNINVRGLVRYQGANFQDSVNDAIISSLGFNFQF